MCFPCRIQDLTWLQVDVALNIENNVEGKISILKPYVFSEAW